MSLKIILNAKPIAKQRPRFSKFGGVYDCQKKEQWNTKQQIKKQIESEYEMNKDDVLVKEGVPLKMNIVFKTSMPKSFSKKKKKELDGKPDLRRPDLDNYEKFYMDVMNNLVYKDDSQICKIISEKVYAVESSVEICLEEII